ncbi:mannitol dehydrogenase family protein [Jiangella rhizosphaerae]|uniref:Mannitol dehydrogenase family protein n=1 Tax=Jiangella rhizosphaerae TaxID=2293569 RepID=A0A418KRG9_9ACTN|nr:mannitol dehydrogenase family protein [Jiangella rhizosphaerae]RIQ23835.1 mannitol dehydrogenase family protein [Jiangella rhizosphaerae]
MAARGGDVTVAHLSRAEPAPRPGVVHLGVGAFHRAHQAVYTDRAMAATGDQRWGIVEVAPRSTDVVAALRRQGGLFTVLERSGDRVTANVVGSVAEAWHAPSEWDEVAARFADPRIAVVTLTITEKGYLADAVTGALLDDDIVRADVAAVAAGERPRTGLGLLVAGLRGRLAADAGPVTVLSCDNLVGNGRRLGALVGEFVSRLPGTAGPALAAWIASSARFPSAMVDRIVPATTPTDRADAARLVGAIDDAVVAAEPFTQWVIENDFGGDRPPWERAGVELVADVAPHETAKLRVLNAAHSMIAYLGALAGHETIAAAVADPAIRGAVEALHRDVLATVDAPPGWDLRAYAASVLERFANPALGHRCDQVAADGSQKLPVRVVPTILAARAAGRPSAAATLVVAAWLRFVVAGRSDDGRPLTVDDPARDALRAVPASDAGRLLRAAAVVPPELAADDAWVGDVTRYLDDLARHGAVATTAALT